MSVLRGHKSGFTSTVVGMLCWLFDSAATRSRQQCVCGGDEQNDGVIGPR